MNDAAWLMFAGAAAWLGIGAYLLYLARRTTALEARLRTLEKELDEKDGCPEAAENTCTRHISGREDNRDAR